MASLISVLVFVSESLLSSSGSILASNIKRYRLGPQRCPTRGVVAPQRGSGQSRCKQLDRDREGKTLDSRDSSGGQLGDLGALKALGPFRELEGEWPMGHEV